MSSVGTATDTCLRLMVSSLQPFPAVVTCCTYPLREPDRVRESELLVGMSDQSVLHEYMEWIVSFLEKRREETGGLPVCPFAKAGLARGKATLAVGKLTRSFVMAQVRRLKATKADTMTIIDPRKTGMSWQEARRLCEVVNREMFPKVLAISLHPEDPFNIAGLHTRRAPYPSIQLTEEKGGDAAFENLKTTDYYGHWTEQNDKDCYLGIESEALDLIRARAKPYRLQ
jgi:hypothetical protein